MNIVSIDISNFLIINSATLSLHDKGLVRVSGENNDDTTSSSNGSGKSSVFEAIYWCLFGDTLRSLKSADSVVNRNVGSDCSVVLNMEDTGRTYRVERYRKHSKNKNNLYLYINDVDSRGQNNKETQEFIEEIIGVDKVAFAASIVFGQGYSKNLRRFSELTDKEQKECLERILELEVFAQSHDVVREALKGFKLERESLVRQEARIESSIESLETEISSAQEENNSFKTTIESLLVDIAAKQVGISQEIGEIDERLLTVQEVDVAAAKNQIESCRSLRKDVCSAVDKLKAGYFCRHNDTTVTKNGVSKDISVLETKLNKLSDGTDEGEDCLYCGQTILESRIKVHADGLDFEIQDRQRTVDSLEEKLARLDATYKKKLSKLTETLVAVEEAVDAAEAQLATEKQEKFT